MKKLRRIGLAVLAVSALALSSLAHADTYGISTDQNGVNTQTYSSMNGTAKSENVNFNSSAVQDSLRFKQTDVGTTTAAATENIDVNIGDGTEVWYFQPTKLMGIINALVLVHVFVEADGDITLEYPLWWDLFGKADDKDVLRGKIEAAVADSDGEDELEDAIMEAMKDGIAESGFATSTEAILR